MTALGRAVKEEGHLVEVVLPKYAFFNASPVLGGMTYETEFEFGGTRVYVCSCIVEGLRVFFLEPKNGYFDTPTVYGRADDELRFDFFCRAALEFLLQSGRQPDILHCHDWSTAHVAAALAEGYRHYGLWKPATVFTIHNLNYGQKKIAEAAYHCARFTTVSPTYAAEIRSAAPIAAHAHKMVGIRNGIDPELWAPDANAWLPTPYTADNVDEGKAAARAALRQRLGLTGWGDKFVVAVVSRLTGQKGVPLIKHAAFKALERGGQFVLLGSAPDPKVLLLLLLRFAFCFVFAFVCLFVRLFTFVCFVLLFLCGSLVLLFWCCCCGRVCVSWARAAAPPPPRAAAAGTDVGVLRE